ncbi:BQ2448_4145 [Microbotryum intermedium]|uniref:BQ2448_4145 protein n=1 Tax=Microbotryum intermedium TaxID=269621 RepID=A0A238FN33_9BASI|nr:BQ2448_4145 [Microbotryum intermedium]
MSSSSSNPSTAAKVELKLTLLSAGPAHRTTRFLSVPETPCPTWDDFLVLLRDRFQLDASTPIVGLTYRDTEGDEILLSSDDELQDWWSTLTTAKLVASAAGTSTKPSTATTTSACILVDEQAQYAALDEEQSQLLGHVKSMIQKDHSFAHRVGKTIGEALHSHHHGRRGRPPPPPYGSVARHSHAHPPPSLGGPDRHPRPHHGQRPSFARPFSGHAHGHGHGGPRGFFGHCPRSSGVFGPPWAPSSSSSTSSDSSSSSSSSDSESDVEGDEPSKKHGKDKKHRRGGRHNGHRKHPRHPSSTPVTDTDDTDTGMVTDSTLALLARLLSPNRLTINPSTNWSISNSKCSIWTNKIRGLLVIITTGMATIATTKVPVIIMDFLVIRSTTDS